MFINQDQYIPVLTQEAGLRVLLHKQGQVPIMEEDGFDVEPGTKSGIAIQYVSYCFGGTFHLLRMDRKMLPVHRESA